MQKNIVFWKEGNEILSPIIRPIARYAVAASLLEPKIGIRGHLPSLPPHDEDLDFSHFDDFDLIDGAASRQVLLENEL